MVTFQEFQKLELKIGKIIKAEKVSGSDRLLKLEVDLGAEIRQIVAGIAEFYQIQDLIGRQVVVFANLEPKEFMGVESQGMLLAADVDGKPVFLRPDTEVPAGAKVR
jgi:methionine--tRNA ligase beta chain